MHREGKKISLKTDRADVKLKCFFVLERKSLLE